MWGENAVEPTLETNGAGKSTIWNALTWCLFGRTCDGLRGPDVVPWTYNGRPWVTVHFDLDDELHQVQRGANPNILRFNGADIDPLALQRKLGMNFDTFTHTQILGQDRTQSPLFFDLPPRGKLQLFSDALDLERWDKRRRRPMMPPRRWRGKSTVTKAASTGCWRSTAKSRNCTNAPKCRPSNGTPPDNCGCRPTTPNCRNSPPA
jgi:hypothetical protein